MNFEWVIPVVVLIVWLLNKLLRGQEEEEAVKPARGGATRSPSSDIDRFLEEIERMRRSKAEEPPVVRPVPAPAPVPVPIERARPVPRPRPVVRPAAQVVEPPQVLPVPDRVAAPPAVPVPEAAKPFVSALPKRKQTPASVTLAGLLRSPQSIRAAVVLQEVFGKPKAKR